MPPKLSNKVPDTLHNVVTGGIMGVLGLGALTVILDPGSVKSYANEVEYAKANGRELRGRKQHRCNDRLEDFIQALASEEASTFRDFGPTARLMIKCFMSKPGQEPDDAYILLGPWNPCYIDPAHRAEARSESFASGGVQLPR
ncbi:hypothetical protein CEUSTIGMA_g1203.t1 [Chlamydomonas eustigma]|uniref:Uncharacterized protein n=1 Tax=Chlamydomonas eustigma TaxID=1157962 RepID=A0A250WSJ0_9CHLO|nr:hypothetical protein CEUSTIGMA_g1203.t1 [Chlamydomonas eustigma]|eukprot:GAX73751.1 hypothetical protein CEUSTIGMA_g1203.t1 [Chlamydomonas eustigma]